MNTAVANFKKFRYLLYELIKKDIKLKYRSSVLGILWTLLEPLLTMIVLTVVFSGLLGKGDDNFPVYILCGRLLYSFFSTGTKTALKSIRKNATTIRKVYVPKYMYPLAATLSNMWNAAIKRVFDLLLGTLALLVFAIPMAIIAILIKATSKGPVIFSQVRVGLHGEEFKMYKFRSMCVQNPDKEKTQWTTKNDSRVTGIGKIIRKTSLDELPQLFNVIGGSMSLVGPRPERPQFVEQFKEEIPRYMIKHQVRPGMSGWAQINGFRGDTSINGRIDHDLFYIENWSLWLDIKILFLTVFKGFINKNAY